MNGPHLPSTNAVDFLLAHRMSEQPALIHGERQCSHRDLATSVDFTAGWLQQNGMQPGDVGAVVGDNSIEWVIWYLALMRCGAVAMPLVCLLSAWYVVFRHLFFIPVVSLLVATADFIYRGILP